MVTLPINESIRKLLNTGNPQLIIISNLDNCNVTLQMILDKAKVKPEEAVKQWNQENPIA